MVETRNRENLRCLQDVLSDEITAKVGIVKKKKFLYFLLRKCN